MANGNLSPSKILISRKEREMQSPNLFLVGASKSGTTTLYEYLNMHQEILMSSKKEPAFFDKDRLFQKRVADCTMRNTYLKYFNISKSDKCISNVKWIGEATSFYLIHPLVPFRIRRMLGRDVKIIICLRDPVQRAYSHYWEAVSRGLEDASINASFIDERPASVFGSDNFPKYYLLTGRYWIHIMRYINFFGNNNVFLIKFEDLISNTDVVLNSLSDFLQIGSFPNIKIQANPHKVPINFKLQNILASPNLFKNMIKPILPKYARKKTVNFIMNKNLKNDKYVPMPYNLKVRLGKYYYLDNIRLKSDLGFDISGWITKEGDTF